MRAKVKISVISTGQEFLLLVAKMNLKGILVFSPQLIAANTELLLELKLGKENPILLKGFVHKTSNDGSSKKGMVIAFLNPSAETKASVEKFIDITQDTKKSRKKKSTKKKSPASEKQGKMKVTRKQKTAADNEKDSDVIQPEKTVIVDNTLPALSLQSPDNKKELMVSTKDEENIHHAGQGLAGETRHVQIHDTLSRKARPKKPLITKLYRALGVVLVIVAIVLFFRHGIGWIETEFGISLMPKSAPQANSGNLPLPTVTSQSPNGQNAPTANGSLDAITIDDQGDFLKITLLGDGHYDTFQTKKLKNPHRIVFTFDRITTINQKLPLKVNRSPVSKIEASVANGKMTLTMFMLKKRFMEFDAKPFPNAMDVFFYRE